MSDKSLKKTHGLIVETLDGLVKHLEEIEDKVRLGESEEPYLGSNHEAPPQPYFWLLSVHNMEYMDLEVANGAVIETSTGVVTDRYGRAEVRVGDSDNDGMGSSAGVVTCDYFPTNNSKGRIKSSLEASLLDLVDEAWDVAIEDYNDKQTASAMEFRRDKHLPDFSEIEEAWDDVKEPKRAKIPESTIKKNFRYISEVLAKPDYVKDSSIKLELKSFTEYIFTSEGTRIAQQVPYVRIKMYVQGRGLEVKDTENGPLEVDDGTTVEHWKNFYCRDFNKIMTREQLEEEADILLEELDELRRVEKVLEGLKGPALLNPSCADTLLHEAFESHRLNPMREGAKDAHQPMGGMLDKKIFPWFIDAYSDPTLKRWKGEDVNGHVEYDSQGIDAQRVDLVKRGKIVNFLFSRDPIMDFYGNIYNKSNGHARMEYSFFDEEGDELEPEARKSTFVLESKKELTKPDLMKKFSSMIRSGNNEYGLIIEQANTGYCMMEAETYWDEENDTSMQYLSVAPIWIYKYDPRAKKKKTLVRGANIIGTPMSVLRDNLVATGKDYELVNGRCGSGSGIIYVSTITPSLLFKKIELSPLYETSAPSRVPKPKRSSSRSRR